MTELYTDEDVKVAQEAIGDFFGPDGNFDFYAAREAVAAVAPAIAAKALRDLAEAANNWRLPVLDGGSSYIDLRRRADETEGTK